MSECDGGSVELWRGAKDQERKIQESNISWRVNLVKTSRVGGNAKTVEGAKKPIRSLARLILIL